VNVSCETQHSFFCIACQFQRRRESGRVPLKLDCLDAGDVEDARVFIGGCESKLNRSDSVRAYASPHRHHWTALELHDTAAIWLDPFHAGFNSSEVSHEPFTV
jgi:hypothetical protein